MNSVVEAVCSAATGVAVMVENVFDYATPAPAVVHAPDVTTVESKSLLTMLTKNVFVFTFIWWF